MQNHHGIRIKGVIAVLDIGKTNKKIVLFDQDLQIVASRKKRIDPIEERGIRAENVAEIEEWFLRTITELSRDFKIEVISVSAHGATAVCVDQNGRVTVPPVDYTQSVQSDVHTRFHTQMGTPEELQLRTATVEVRPLVNIGKSLFFLKEQFPDEFERTRYLLPYPQYFVYKLTGFPTADITSIGCHSYLWDYDRNDWSNVVDNLDLREALPETPSLPSDIVGTITLEVAKRTGLSPRVIVTAGIHDSNSSLIPYLIARDRDFVLNSTGTWCVAMHPEREVHFQSDELGIMVFYNLSYEGSPVKTSILMGGLERETYRGILEQRHGGFEDAPSDGSLLEEIVGARKDFVLPSVLPGAGQFPQSVARIVRFCNESTVSIPLDEIRSGKRWPELFSSPQRALGVVDLSVALQTIVALRRVGLASGTDIFIEGGFRNNSTYLACLATLLPENRIYRTQVDEATALGAALCGVAAIEKTSIGELKNRVSLGEVAVQVTPVPGIEAYAKVYYDLLSEG